MRERQVLPPQVSKILKILFKNAKNDHRNGEMRKQVRRAASWAWGREKKKKTEIIQ